VINAVRPDAVALELCEKRALQLRNWKPGYAYLFRMFLSSMRASDGLKRKVHSLFELRWFQAKCRRSMEFKVAMEESQKVKAARLVLIDQDTDVFRKQFRSLNIIQNINFQWFDNVDLLIYCLKRWLMLLFFPEKSPRSNMKGMLCWFHLVFPEHSKLVFLKRDVLMCVRLRRLEEKRIVAVVGLGHMDGIERTWKIAEDIHRGL
ncbi:hypothetical protein MKW94_014129, partial [Papaver nudicaule]|nr:hypothetical protein [Papaver nudicaule]